MSLAISNAKNVVIKNFSVIQPQFWASIIIKSENVLVQDFYVNATSYNPSVSETDLGRTFVADRQATYDRKSWLENTDGLDTWRSKNVTVRTSGSCHRLRNGSSPSREHGVSRW
jgi:polygalacturonase